MLKVTGIIAELIKKDNNIMSANLCDIPKISTYAPTIIILSGIAGVDKTTYINAHLQGFKVHSFDNIMSNMYPKATYIESYDAYTNDKKNKHLVSLGMDKQIKEWLANDVNIIVDMTMLTVKNRASILKLVPEHYNKKVITFNIPFEVLERMVNSYEAPTFKEGFNTCLEVGVFKELTP